MRRGLKTQRPSVTMALMPRAFAAVLLLCLLAPAQEVAPTGITCCDERKIRQAMTEEALQRIIARHEHGAGATGDYLSAQAYAAIRRRLPAGSREQLLDFLRAALRQQGADPDNGEFQRQIGLFVLGMTLEVGGTFQDEFDLAAACKEKVVKLLAALEKSPRPDTEALDRALFHADLTTRELRRIRSLERKWKNVPDGASTFTEFNILKKNATGREHDPDQWLAFELAGHYREPFPFLDEFMENYRRLAADFREAVRRLNQLLAFIEQ
jgi:hypothetical protein